MYGNSFFQCIYSASSLKSGFFSFLVRLLILKICIQTKPFCGFVFIFVVIGDGTGSFKTVNLEVFKLKKEKLFFLISKLGILIL